MKGRICVGACIVLLGGCAGDTPPAESGPVTLDTGVDGDALSATDSSGHDASGRGDGETGEGHDVAELTDASQAGETDLPDSVDAEAETNGSEAGCGEGCDLGVSSCDGHRLLACVQVAGCPVFVEEQQCSEGSFCDEASADCLPVEPRCDDGVTNGVETDLDCGGADCDPCNVGSDCNLDEDCATARCTASACVSPTCGDGVLDVGEICDRGDRNSDTGPDACRENCELANCGDGVVDSDEACEPGDDQPLCTTACELNVCGDGYVLGVEECDDGSDNNWAADACRPGRFAPRCGDGAVDTGELCDDGESNGVGDYECNVVCARPRCGDASRDPGESCDDGDNDDADSCNSHCETSRCGNGRIDGDDDCDDGELNANRADACRLDCTVPRCGDLIRDTSEECDAGFDPEMWGWCSDSCELPGLPSGCTYIEISGTGSPLVSGSNDAASDDLYSPCESERRGVDTVYLWHAPAAGRYRLDTIGSASDTIVTVRNLANRCEMAWPIACNDDAPWSPLGGASDLIFTVEYASPYYIVVDTIFDESQEFVLNVQHFD